MNEVGGLPTHILLVHAVVVLLPITALLVAAGGVSGRVRRRLGVAPAVLAIVLAILVPITASTGDWLLPRVGGPPAAVEHGQQGASLPYFSAALALVAIGQYLWWRHQGRRPEGQRGPAAVGVILLVLALVVPAATIVRTVQVGDSGARSVWEGNYRTD